MDQLCITGDFWNCGFRCQYVSDRPETVRRTLQCPSSVSQMSYARSPLCRQFPIWQQQYGDRKACRLFSNWPTMDEGDRSTISNSVFDSQQCFSSFRSCDRHSIRTDLFPEAWPIDSNFIVRKKPLLPGPARSAGRERAKSIRGVCLDSPERRADTAEFNDRIKSG